MTSDRIEKKILLRASRERVWRAVSDSAEFGRWFGARFDGPFVAGRSLRGRIVPTEMDAEVAEQQKPYDGMEFEVRVEQIEPMRRLAFRWHPYAVDVKDFATEPTTLVTFELAEAAGGILLSIVESGFDAIPLARRAEAFKANEEGWDAQTRLVQKYLAAQTTA